MSQHDSNDIFLDAVKRLDQAFRYAEIDPSAVHRQPRRPRSDVP